MPRRGVEAHPSPKPPERGTRYGDHHIDRTALRGWEDVAWQDVRCLAAVLSPLASLAQQYRRGCQSQPRPVDRENRPNESGNPPCNPLIVLAKIVLSGSLSIKVIDPC